MKGVRSVLCNRKMPVCVCVFLHVLHAACIYVGDEVNGRRNSLIKNSKFVGENHFCPYVLRDSAQNTHGTGDSADWNPNV